MFTPLRVSTSTGPGGWSSRSWLPTNRPYQNTRPTREHRAGVPAPSLTMTVAAPDRTHGRIAVVGLDPRQPVRPGLGVVVGEADHVAGDRVQAGVERGGQTPSAHGGRAHLRAAIAPRRERLLRRRIAVVHDHDDPIGRPRLAGESRQTPAQILHPIQGGHDHGDSHRAVSRRERGARGRGAHEGGWERRHRSSPSCPDVMAGWSHRRARANSVTRPSTIRSRRWVASHGHLRDGRGGARYSIVTTNRGIKCKKKRCTLPGWTRAPMRTFEILKMVHTAEHQEAPRPPDWHAHGPRG